jgi:DNA-binding HxlR family transcriptional regulator
VGGSVENSAEQEFQGCGCSEPGDANASTCFCAVDDLMRVIRRRYSLIVMNAIHGRGRMRYHDVAALLPAISSSTLSETLRALETTGLLERRQEAAERPYMLYSLTESGVKLLNRLRQLLGELE